MKSSLLICAVIDTYTTSLITIAENANKMIYLPYMHCMDSIPSFALVIGLPRLVRRAFLVLSRANSAAPVKLHIPSSALVSLLIELAFSFLYSS